MTKRIEQMTLWRLDRQQWVDNDSCCSGSGASLYPGRWNQEGESVLYTASNISLAFLEIYVHLSFQNCSPQQARANMSRRIVQIYLDGLNYEEISIDRLVKKWRTLRPSDIPSQPSILQRFGSEWFKSVRTPILKVPSAVVPYEANYLINPSHPDIQGRLLLANTASNLGQIGHVSVGILPEPFTFDSRYIRTLIRAKPL